MKSCLPALLILPALLTVQLAPSTAEAQWGSIKGKIVLKEAAPKPTLAIKKGDGTVKDAAVCAADNLYGNELVIDADTKGIANVFIYMRSAKKIHPDLEDGSKRPKLVQDQKGCRFYPHAMFVQSGQEVQIISNDPVLHNTHGVFFKNPSFNESIRPNDQVGLKKVFKARESLPMQIKCDIHPHMRCYWLILDHPYAAVTNEKGEFEIKNLPEGSHTFRVWHEKAGYLERSYKVKVSGGKTTELKPVSFGLSDFDG